MTLLLQDPSGQCAARMAGPTTTCSTTCSISSPSTRWPSGPTGRGDARLAGQYRHAAMLGFRSIAPLAADRRAVGRVRTTSPRTTSTRPERVGYQPASKYGNYNGAVMIHLAEAYLPARPTIAERPAPVEIGGYAFATDERFASAVANAGGMQLFAALRGDTAVALRSVLDGAGRRAVRPRGLGHPPRALRRGTRPQDGPGRHLRADLEGGRPLGAAGRRAGSIPGAASASSSPTRCSSAARSTIARSSGDGPSVPSRVRADAGRRPGDAPIGRTRPNSA